MRSRGRTDEARKALSELCETCYAPVFAFIRASAADEDATRDLTQEFFARVLRGGAFDRADPLKGRFRSFLLGAVKHFLADMRDRARAWKRGAGQELVPLEAPTDTSAGLEVADPASQVSDRVFDRQWAFALLDRALRKLEAEMAAAQQSSQFDLLKPWLTGQAPTPQSEVAARLGLNENAVKVAIHRLRVRFREIVRTEIRDTVDDPAEVPSELGYLIEVVSG